MKRMWSKNELNRITALLLASGQLQEVDSQDFKINGESALQQWNGELVAMTGITYSGVFCKAVRNFNEIQFIMNFRATNTTEADITIANDTKRCDFKGLPDEIKEKIYCHNGNKLTEETSNQSVAYASLFVSATGGAIDSTNMPRYVNLYYLGNTTSKNLAFYLEGGNVVIPAGQSRDFEARISLAL